MRIIERRSNDNQTSFRPDGISAVATAGDPIAPENGWRVLDLPLFAGIAAWNRRNRDAGDQWIAFHGRSVVHPVMPSRRVPRSAMRSALHDDPLPMTVLSL
jgi:hypothetical protein